MLWDSSLESGVPIIDYEHQLLVGHLENLINESNPEQAREMLVFLADYVVKHFAHEQVLHRGSGYEKAEEHKVAHKDFVETIITLEEEYDDKGNDPEMLIKITDVVKDWLRDHIKGADMEFAEYYKEYVKNHPLGEEEKKE